MLVIQQNIGYQLNTEDFSCPIVKLFLYSYGTRIRRRNVAQRLQYAPTYRHYRGQLYLNEESVGS